MDSYYRNTRMEKQYRGISQCGILIRLQNLKHEQPKHTRVLDYVDQGYISRINIDSASDMGITIKNAMRKKLRRQLLIKTLMVQAGNDSHILKIQIKKIIDRLSKL